MGVERQRLAEACVAEPLPADHSLLPFLGERLTARILFAIGGTSSRREREDPDSLNPTTIRNRFNGSLMREISMLHSINPKLMLPLQTHLGVAVRAAVNMSELSQYLRSFQIVPDEEVSRQWLLQVQQQAHRHRVERLQEWMAQGDGWTVRFDNCDVGKLLHFVALIATRDRRPPPLPFPFTPYLNANLVAWPWQDGPWLPRISVRPALTSIFYFNFAYLSAIEVLAVEQWRAPFGAAAALIDVADASLGRTLNRAALGKRTRGGLETKTRHTARALGAELEAQALGPPPVEPAASDRTFAEGTKRTRMQSPVPLLYTACCDYSPCHLESAATVRVGERVEVVYGDPHDRVLLVRAPASSSPLLLPAYVIGRGEMVPLSERDAWEASLVEDASVDPRCDRMGLMRELLVDPGDAESRGSITFNVAGASEGGWTAEHAQARRQRRAAQGGDGDSSAELPTGDAADRVSLAPPEPPLPTNLSVRGRHASDLLYLAPLLEKASDPGATQAPLDTAETCPGHLGTAC